MGKIPADTIIENVSVLTMDPSHPYTKGIAIANGLIVGLLDDNAVWPLASAGKRINGEGKTLLPGIIDAHCHLRAQISHNLSVPCGREDVCNIEEIQKAIHERAAYTSPGTWIRAAGYDPFYLYERRHPTRLQLDEAAPNHPVRLRHITRHVSVLNSVALALAGIGADTPDPPGVNIERDGKTGIPTGIIYGGDAWLSQHIVPPLAADELQSGAKLLHQELLCKGITSVQDATPSNTAFDVRFWASCIDEGWTIPIQLMADIHHYKDVMDYCTDQLTSLQKKRLETGAIKVVMEASPDLSPDLNELKKIVIEATQQSLPVAIHVVTPEMVWSALEAIRNAQEMAPDRKIRHRLEHISLCPDAFLPDMAELQIMAVTNPSLVHEHGDRYLADVEQSEHSWLYLMNSLREAGIPLAAGSDAPVASFDPWAGIQAACTRTTNSGKYVNPAEKLSRYQALEMFTSSAARAAGWETKRGMIRPGLHADFLLVDRHPLFCPDKQLSRIQVCQTWIDGTLVFAK
ncbi:MAG: amidohydrolase [Bacillus sp. (in: firmicutes)]